MTARVILLECKDTNAIGIIWSFIQRRFSFGSQPSACYMFHFSDTSRFRPFFRVFHSSILSSENCIFMLTN